MTNFLIFATNSRHLNETPTISLAKKPSLIQTILKVRRSSFFNETQRLIASDSIPFKIFTRLKTDPWSWGGHVSGQNNTTASSSLSTKQASCEDLIILLANTAGSKCNYKEPIEAVHTNDVTGAIQPIALTANKKSQSEIACKSEETDAEKKKNNWNSCREI